MFPYFWDSIYNLEIKHLKKKSSKFYVPRNKVLSSVKFKKRYMVYFQQETIRINLSTIKKFEIWYCQDIFFNKYIQ